MTILISNASKGVGTLIKSMTGFGRGRFSSPGFACSVEVRSVNHRFLDLHVRVPTELSPLEVPLRRFIQSKIRRGRIDLVVLVEKNDTVNLSLNRPLLEAYLRILETLKAETRAMVEPDLVQILRIPGIISTESPLSSSASFEQLKTDVTRAAEEALSSLESMKVQEGQALARDIRDRLDSIEKATATIEASSEGLLSAYHQKISTRLKEWIGEIPVDPVRVAQEAALYVERSSIAEEITRLRSHVVQARSLVDGGQDIGKTLDFLLQEMNREANTMLSKTTGITGNGLEIANSAILVKSEIEKIREQAQNVE
ncbi:MAG: YicC/YloC family endoribonuclease [Acidobacteriota bacterium]